MNAYDRVLYANRPYAQTHPSRLFVQARLAGLDPSPVETCRVLDIGASEGANIIGMAVVLPTAEFVGIDLAAEPVTRGKRTIASLRLGNVRLERMDLLDLDESFGKFDYIVAHGLYAWTPPEVRDKILAIARANLHPHGVAFVSYNTQPGGHLRQMLREMMLYHAGPRDDPGERLDRAREILKLAAEGRPENDALDAAIAAQAAELLTRSDSALFHDELGDIYEPVYFHDFVAHAARHGLAYLGDAGVLDSAPRNLSSEAIAAVDQMAAGDPIARQQYFDFLRAPKISTVSAVSRGSLSFRRQRACRLRGRSRLGPAQNRRMLRGFSRPRISGPSRIFGSRLREPCREHADDASSRAGRVSAAPHRALAANRASDAH